MTEAISDQLSALSLATAGLSTETFTTEAPRKTIRQKRRDAETQRRKGLLPGATGRPPMPTLPAPRVHGCAVTVLRTVRDVPPFGHAVRSALGSESELSSPFASLSAVGSAPQWRTSRRVSRLPELWRSSDESPAAREACLGGGTGGPESLFSGPFVHTTERERSPRLPGSTPGSSNSHFAPLRLCVSALNSSPSSLRFLCALCVFAVQISPPDLRVRS